jgi:hypothetical protein
MAGAAGAPLSREQKRDVVMMAREAWFVQGKPGFAGQPDDIPEVMKLSEREAFDVWRHDEQAKVDGGKHHLTAAQNHNFPLLMAHFAELAGQHDVADRWLRRTVGNDRRQAMAKLMRELYLAADVIEKPREYAESICRCKCKCGIEEASPKQLWSLVFDVRRAAQKRRAKSTFAHRDIRPGRDLAKRAENAEGNQTKLRLVPDWVGDCGR